MIDFADPQILAAALKATKAIYINLLVTMARIISPSNPWDFYMGRCPMPFNHSIAVKISAKLKNDSINYDVMFIREMFIAMAGDGFITIHETPFRNSNGEPIINITCTPKVIKLYRTQLTRVIRKPNRKEKT